MHLKTPQKKQNGKREKMRDRSEGQLRSTHTASSSMLRPCRLHPSLLSPVIASRGVFKWAIAKQRRHAVAVVIGADRVLRPISGSAPIVLTRMRILRDESGDSLVCADQVAKRRIGLNTRDGMPDKAHQPPLSDPRGGSKQR